MPCRWRIRCLVEFAHEMRSLRSAAEKRIQQLTANFNRDISTSPIKVRKWLTRISSFSKRDAIVSCEREGGFPRVSKFVALLVAVLALVVPAWSQGNDGRILGAVTDQGGGAVVAASVTVLDVARGVARTLITDSGGEYSAPSLVPGKYEVTVEAMGFTKFDRQNITVEVGQDVRVDASLMVGAQTQTVTVTEEV